MPAKKKPAPPKTPAKPLPSDSEHEAAPSKRKKGGGDGADE